MVASGYLFSACGLVFLAILVSLMRRFDPNVWLTQGLRRGDLYSLCDVASGLRPDGLTRDQARRLQARGLVRSYDNGTFRATIKGRLALRVRQVIRGNVHA